MSAKEKAAEIRKELKAAGIKKGVSVTSAIHGCEECITVKVKDPTIDIREVRAHAEKWSKVDYDQYSGEVLGGGNTFVFTDYAYNCFDEVTKPYMERAEELVAAAGSDPVAIAPGLFMDWQDIRGNGIVSHGGYPPAVARALYMWDTFGTVGLR